MTENSFDVRAFLPQRPPMLLVDELLRGDDTSGEVRSMVRDSWPLCSQNQVPGLVLVEVFAQSAAVVVGHKNRHTEEQGGRGWLVGIRRTKIFTHKINVGSELITALATDYEVENYAVFKGQIHSDGELLAQVEIQTYRPDKSFWDEGGEQNER